MQEISLHEIEQINGGRMAGFFVGYLAGKALDWVVDAVSSGGVDYSGYVNDNPNYWVGA